MKRKQNVLLKGLTAAVLTTVIASIWAGSAYAVTAGRIVRTKASIDKMDSETVSENAIVYDFSKMSDVPLYSEETGYGFVSQTRLEPSRKLNTKKIKMTDEGAQITETNPTKFDMTDDDGNQLAINKCTTRDFGGFVFRFDAEPGAYRITVETGDVQNSLVTVSGMDNSRIEMTGAWDAAKLIPMAHPAVWEGNTWTFEYANGLDTIDIEIEPTKVNIPVQVKKITVEPIEVSEREEGEKPTIFTLGDSTVKSYTFDEAPMSSWGQVFDNLFDTKLVNVINYSMGGRSVRQMYNEGRLNDILLTGKKGDIILIQSGHNDESNGTEKGTASGETARFGVGATEEMYKDYLEQVYIPAIEARGMIPVLVSPCTRISRDSDGTFKNSFTTRKFPDVMREVAEETNTEFIDLNTRSVEYFNEMGESIYNIVMSLEAGETPGKTSSGSYANGHPSNKIDGTHYKEALAKQYCRIILEEFTKSTSDTADTVLSYVKPEVSEALESGDWSKVYPEICNDTITGDGSYYRNQIEKLVQLGIMEKDEKGNFNPDDTVTVSEFIGYMEKLWGINKNVFQGYSDGVLTREVMAAVVYDAYVANFGYDENGNINRPAYMTDYNGTTVTPDDPNYDPNLVGEESQYYPLAGYNALKDTNEISKEYATKFKEAYNLGLIRSEEGIERGSMINGLYVTPKTEVTRAKAAKELYFLWVLDQNVSEENG